MEKTALRPPRPTTQTRETPAGFVHCSRCEELTAPADLYLTEAGEICHLCQADDDATETLSRGTRQQAAGVFFSPAYSAIIVAIFRPLAALLFGVAGAAKVLSFIPIVGALVTAYICWTAWTRPGSKVDRGMLGVAALFATLVQGFAGLALLLM